MRSWFVSVVGDWGRWIIRMAVALAISAMPLPSRNRPVSACLVHDPRGAGDSNRTAGLRRNFGTQTRAHAHILALHEIDRTAVGPIDVAQVTGKCRRRGTRRRIFVDTTGCKRIARVEPLRRLG